MGGFWTPEMSGGAMAVAGGFVVWLVKELSPVIKVKFARNSGGDASDGCPDKACKSSITTLVAKSEERAAAVQDVKRNQEEIFKRLSTMETGFAEVRGWIKGRLKEGMES